VVFREFVMATIWPNQWFSKGDKWGQTLQGASHRAILQLRTCFQAEI